MSSTLGCTEDHVTVCLGFRVAAAMAADQGEQTTWWDWPIQIPIAGTA